MNAIDFSKINEKLREDNVYFMDEAEVYVVVADVTKKEARLALDLHDQEMDGQDFPDDLELEAVSFYEAPSPEGEEGWIWWTNPKGKSKFLTKGWIARI